MTVALRVSAATLALLCSCGGKVDPSRVTASASSAGGHAGSATTTRRNSDAGTPPPSSTEGAGGLSAAAGGGMATSVAAEGGRPAPTSTSAPDKCPPDVARAPCDAGCLPGLTCCGGVCVSLANDLDHCGACGVRCSGSTPVCFSGVCEPAPCDSACTNGGTCCGQVCCPTGSYCCAEVQNTASFPTDPAPLAGAGLMAFACTPTCGTRRCEPVDDHFHSSSKLSPCNDGSGRTDCCPPGVAGGLASATVPCEDDGLECWMPCVQGRRERLICTSRFWMALIGGNYACSPDAG